jgi:hypothetical protein
MLVAVAMVVLFLKQRVTRSLTVKYDRRGEETKRKAVQKLRF